jgi:GxxExxY protein
MRTNDTNTTNTLIYPELSCIITGVCFDIHNNLGRFAREKQYGNEIEKQLKEANLLFQREKAVGDTGNIIDVLIEDKIILEIKTKPSIVKNDYFQVQRYLQSSQIKLGLLINFRNRHIKPIRIIRVDT